MYYIRAAAEISSRSSTTDVTVEVNTNHYWTWVEQFPVHLGRYADAIVPRAKEAFLSAMSCLSDGKPVSISYGPPNLCLSDVMHY